MDSRKPMPWWGWLLVPLVPPAIVVALIVLPPVVLCALMVGAVCDTMGWEHPAWLGNF